MQWHHEKRKRQERKLLTSMSTPRRSISWAVRKRADDLRRRWRTPPPVDPPLLSAAADPSFKLGDAPSFCVATWPANGFLALPEAPEAPQVPRWSSLVSDVECSAQDAGDDASTAERLHGRCALLRCRLRITTGASPKEASGRMKVRLSDTFRLLPASSVSISALDSSPDVSSLLASPSSVL